MIYLIKFDNEISELFISFILPPGNRPKSVSNTAKSMFFNSTTVFGR